MGMTTYKVPQYTHGAWHKTLVPSFASGNAEKRQPWLQLQLSASHMHQDLPTPGTASAAKKETNHNVVKTYNLLV